MASARTLKRRRQRHGVKRPRAPLSPIEKMVIQRALQAFNLNLALQQRINARWPGEISGARIGTTLNIRRSQE